MTDQKTCECGFITEYVSARAYHCLACSKITVDVGPYTARYDHTFQGEHELKSDELVELRIENERLRALLTPCRPDTDAQTDPSYPATVNDVLHLLSAYFADFLPDHVELSDEYYAAWERQARPVIERIMGRE